MFSLLKEILNDELTDKLNKACSYWEKLFQYAVQIRNLHAHNAGIVNQIFITKCLSQNLIYEDYWENEKKERIDGYTTRLIHGGGKFITIGMYMSVHSLYNVFRAYGNMIAAIIDEHLMKSSPSDLPH